MVWCEGAVLAAMKGQGLALGMVRLGYAADDDHMIARVMAGFEIAFEGGKRACDDRHAAMRQMRWHIADRGL